MHIVPQVAFSPEPILFWVRRLRNLGIDLPVRIGLAGPTNVATLFRYAQRCGVKASTQGLARQAASPSIFLAMRRQTQSISALAQAQSDGQLDDVALHLFRSAARALPRAAATASSGRISLDSGGGFGSNRMGLDSLIKSRIQRAAVTRPGPPRHKPTASRRAYARRRSARGCACRCWRGRPRRYSRDRRLRRCCSGSQPCSAPRRQP